LPSVCSDREAILLPTGQAAPPVSGVHARRVIFIDLARVLAVVMMMYGHTVSALLAPQYRAGRWFEIWNFQRGITSALFLFLSGFAFSIATMRHWPSHTRLTPAVWKRARRFAFFVVLGYVLHMPGRRVVELAATSPERWQSFLAVDVLQLIGVTFIGVQLLTLVVQGRRAFMAASLILAVAIIAAAPGAWATDWTGRVPPAVAAYLTPATGSLFPMLPWSAFVLIGAATGGVYARWGASHLARFATGMLLLPGVVLVALSMIYGRTGVAGGADAFGWVPQIVMQRLAACFLLLGLVAHASRFITRMPHVFGAVAQESLVIYVVHLAMVYGSHWNSGLYKYFADALAPLQTFVVVIFVVVSMTLLAWQWNALKHHRPRAARWLSLGTGGALASFLL
jgi:uncharacterized membrane protein